jgi:hypothetical protein
MQGRVTQWHRKQWKKVGGSVASICDCVTEDVNVVNKLILAYVSVCIHIHFAKYTGSITVSENCTLGSRWD